MTDKKRRMPSGRFARPMSRDGRQLLLMIIVAGLWIGGSGRASAADAVEISTPGGIRAWLAEEHRVPIVALRFTFEGGAAQDPAGLAGLSSLLTEAMQEGAGSDDGDALKEKIARAGLRFSLTTGRDAVHGSLEAISDRLASAAPIVRAILTAPAFKTADIDRIKAQRLTALARDLANPGTIAQEQWYASAFPGHPYATPVAGRTDTLPRVTQASLRAQHQRLFARANLKAVLVGDIDRQAAVRLLDAIFGDLPPQPQLSPVAGAVPLARAEAIVTAVSAPVASAVFGLPGLPPSDSDFAALKVLNQLMGSGDLDSVLMEEIRVKRGLAYSADQRLATDMHAALILGRFSTRDGKMKEALGVLRDLLQRLATDGPTDAQFENARAFLVGSAAISADTSARLAGALLDVWRSGEGPDGLVARTERVRKVSLADVRRVATRLLVQDRLLVSIAGNAN